MRMTPLAELDVNDFDHGDVEDKEQPLHEGMEEMK